MALREGNFSICGISRHGEKHWGTNLNSSGMGQDR